ARSGVGGGGGGEDGGMANRGDGAAGLWSERLAGRCLDPGVIGCDVGIVGEIAGLAAVARAARGDATDDRRVPGPYEEGSARVAVAGVGSGACVVPAHRCGVGDAARAGRGGDRAEALEPVVVAGTARAARPDARAALPRARREA